MRYVIKLKRKAPDCDSYLVWTMVGLGFTETPYIKEASHWNQEDLEDSVLRFAREGGITWEDYEVIKSKDE